MPAKIRLVCATRVSKDRFLAETLLGRSVALLKTLHPIELRLAAENAAGLPEIYNAAIEDAARRPATLVFVHDDVAICDFYWAGRIAAGLRKFDILGVAGNKRRLPGQPGWAFVGRDGGKFVWDKSENLSGVVGHGDAFPGRNLSAYGASGQECKLLDGLLLAADSETLHKAGLRFDPRFKFHCYDMDFCRQAELKGLRMGTWPLSVVHKSIGNFGTEAWTAAFGAYLEKYGESA